ncbi:Cytoskeleton protein RodZ [Pandoraea iniqua]|uniref:helix-turn-helix domain-containing protein n=1 Tax=Pandoraea iniqua TaxID=2508288 RepID=UPI00124243EA|nr:RodZ domain-containing protein [Pandoraea iniqua]VVE02129.1 Cytoskeleton protein RodZ [Pandoraea iniqua]
MDNQNQADAGGQTGTQGQGTPSGSAAGLAELGAQVGAQLAALREKRGMSIEDVSARLKVSVQKLQRLESGQWDALPEMPFIQGVVRSYARMLGGDPEPMIEPLRRFGRTAPIDVPQAPTGQPSIPKSPVRFRSPVAASQAKWPWALAALVVIAGAAWYFGNAHKPTRGSTEPAELASGASAQGAEAAEPASQPVVADANGTPPGADGTNNVNTAANNGNTESTVNTATASSATAGAGLIAAVDPTHVVAGIANAAASAAKAAVPTPAVTASAAGAPVAAGNGKIALHLKADSWVEVRAKDGKVLFSQLMRAGAEQEITGEAPLKVVVGNVAGVESLEFNGQPVEIKSRNAGNVARLTLQ